MPTQQYLALARHAAATMDKAAWRRLVHFSRMLTRDMTLDDIDSVAMALERAKTIERLFPARPRGETVH